MWIRHTVRADKSVITEIDVTGIEAVEIASVAVNHLSALSGPAHGLVHEVPDEPPLELGILANQVPVLFETTLRVTHGVRILALYERLLILVVLAVAFAPFVAGIHRAVDISFSACSRLFVLHGTAWVFRFHPVVGGFEVRTVSGLVAQRPEDNAGMVEAALHIALVTFHVRLLVVGALGKGTFAIAHPMRFDVGFRHHVEAVLVAKFVPQVVVGIVAGTYCIQVKQLHDLDVLNHAFARYYIAIIGIHFVTVGTFKEHRLSVYQNLRVFQLHFAEAYFQRNHLHYFIT